MHVQPEKEEEGRRRKEGGLGELGETAPTRGWMKGNEREREREVGRTTCMLRRGRRIPGERGGGGLAGCDGSDIGIRRGEEGRGEIVYSRSRREDVSFKSFDRKEGRTGRRG